MQGRVTDVERATFFDEDGVRMLRYWFTVAGRQVKLELRESAPLEINVGDEVVMELAADGVLVISLYNTFRDRGHGPRWKHLKRGLGPWAGTRIVRGTVKHKERNRTRDDMSREGYHTSVYFVVELAHGERILVDERAGDPVRPGHEVEALLARGGRTEIDTLAFRDRTAGTDSMPSPWPSRVALVATVVMVGFLVHVVRTQAMDGPRWLMLLLLLAVPGGLWWSFSSGRREVRRALTRLDELRGPEVP